jgi:hypothetical protein
MSCLEPGKSVEATGLILPVRLDEAALALEDIVPRLVNAAADTGDCRAVAAITDKFESCTFEVNEIESIPDAGGPIMPLEGEDSTAAQLDTWLAKGTLLGEDLSYTVFVVFLEVMRRPGQGSWSAQAATVMGTKQSVESLLAELELDKAYAYLPATRP